MIKGEWADQNPTTVRESNSLINGKSYTVVIQVRKNGLWAYLDGKLKARWETDYSDVGGDTNWNLPGNDTLGLGTYESPTDFWRVDLLEVTGKGRLAANKP